jgi:hypothetical protein
LNIFQTFRQLGWRTADRHELGWQIFLDIDLDAFKSGVAL